MHAQLAQLYHLSAQLIHPTLLLVWRPLIVSVALAAASRVLGGTRPPLGAAIVAAAAVLAGWALLDPWGRLWPQSPVARLAGLGAIVLVGAVLRSRLGAAWLLTPAIAAAGAWWLRGAPLTGPAIIICMPVFLGLLAGLALARRLVPRDAGWVAVAGAVTLAAALWAAGAAPHWARAALMPGLAGLALLGEPDVAATLASLVVMVAGAALVASDRGRLLPVDAACLSPILVWATIRLPSLRTGWSGRVVPSR